MRKTFATEMIKLAANDELFFLTGDLGFMALEEVREAFGPRFVNAGVAEQNMIGVAAGLAREGFKTFTYSIAPFNYARPLEQIRNDICFTRLPVYLIGNGGGYAYGYMGPTHHALEDCALMQALPGMRVFAPAFDEDINPILNKITSESGPAYLRLGYDVKPTNGVAPPYDGFRKVLSGTRGVLAALGPMAGLAWAAAADLPEEKRPAVYAVTELPLINLPKMFLEEMEKSGTLFVVEEHVKSGGLGLQLMYLLGLTGLTIRRFEHRYAQGYPSGRYGSQNFHRAECLMDLAGLKQMLGSAD